MNGAGFGDEFDEFDAYREFAMHETKLLVSSGKISSEERALADAFIRSEESPFAEVREDLGQCEKVVPLEERRDAEEDEQSSLIRREGAAHGTSLRLRSRTCAARSPCLHS